MTWIEADILGRNRTPNRYNALAPAIVYVGNDVTIPFNSVASQLQRTLLHMNGTEIGLESMDRCSNISIYFFMYKV